MPAWRRGDPTSDTPELVPPGELVTEPEQATGQAGPPERGEPDSAKRKAGKQPAGRKPSGGKKG